MYHAPQDITGKQWQASTSYPNKHGQVGRNQQHLQSRYLHVNDLPPQKNLRCAKKTEQAHPHPASETSSRSAWVRGVLDGSPCRPVQFYGCGGRRRWAQAAPARVRGVDDYCDLWSFRFLWLKSSAIFVPKWSVFGGPGGNHNNARRPPQQPTGGVLKQLGRVSAKATSPLSCTSFARVSD